MKTDEHFYHQRHFGAQRYSNRTLWTLYLDWKENDEYWSIDASKFIHKNTALKQTKLVIYLLHDSTKYNRVKILIPRKESVLGQHIYFCRRPSGMFPQDPSVADNAARMSVMVGTRLISWHHSTLRNRDRVPRQARHKSPLYSLQKFSMGYAGTLSISHIPRASLGMRLQCIVHLITACVHGWAPTSFAISWVRSSFSNYRFGEVQKTASVAQ